MKKRFKKIVKRSIWFPLSFYRLALRKKSYLNSTGWIESFKRGYPCDSDGFETPWMNYTVNTILKERLNGNLSVFEFGSGYSTFFYARLAKHVVSVEHDMGFFNFMEEKIPDNVSLLYREKDIDGVYCRSITEFKQQFDVVVVDGRDRIHCVKQAIDKLSESGVIILDDSGRKRYFEAIDYANKKDFRALRIEGLKPTAYKIGTTTLLYRDNNCLNI